MSKHSLILLRNDASLAISITPEALAAKQDALDNSRMLQVVGNAKGQDIAVAAQLALQTLINACEASRKDVKAPVLDYGRLIDDTAKNFVDELKAEAGRLSRLLGDFQEAQRARARSEEAARNEQLTMLERAREADLSQAPTLQAREVIHERYNQEAQSLPAPRAVPKADGQTIRDIWEFEVQDIHLLYRHHPHLVKLEPRRMEIIEFLKAGAKLQGIKSWQTTKSSVRP